MRHKIIGMIALLLATICQPVISNMPTLAQPFTSPGTRYGMNVEGPGGTEYAYVDLFHSSSFAMSTGVTPNAQGYPTSSGGGTIWFCVAGDLPGPQIYNFYGEGVFIPSFTGSYSNNQNWPYTDGFVPFNGVVGMRGAIESSVSVLPPNYAGNPSSQWILCKPNTVGNPNANPPIPANPFAITLYIPPNAPANPLNTVVTTCQVQYNIPPRSPNAWVYSPTYGPQGIPLSWIWVTTVNPSNDPNEQPANFHFIRPGYAAATHEYSDYPVTATSNPLFTQEYLKSFGPFCCLRFMDWMNTNGNTGLSWGTNGLVNSGPYDWSQRRKQGVFGDGVCYEYMIALCNATNCDMWFNVPLQATLAWKQGFANLVVNNMNHWLHCHYEHGNELWNWGFIAWQIVDIWAVQDFGTDGKGAWFDHGEEMGKLLMTDVNAMQPIFQQVASDFGRPILAGQFVNPVSYCGGGLYYIQNNYGTPGNFIYGMAGAPYFGLNPSEFTGSDLTNLKANVTMAKQNGIYMCGYEGGQGLNGPTSANDTVDVANQEGQAMATQYNDFAQMWQNNGGDLQNWFTNSGFWSQFGCWGHVPVGNYMDDLSDPAMTRYNAAAAISSVCNCGNAAPPPPPPQTTTGGGGSGTGTGGGPSSTSGSGQSGQSSSASNQMTRFGVTQQQLNNLKQWWSQYSPGGTPQSKGGQN